MLLKIDHFSCFGWNVSAIVGVVVVVLLLLLRERREIGGIVT
jgi:hypothetical protein